MPALPWTYGAWKRPVGPATTLQQCMNYVELCTHVYMCISECVFTDWRVECVPPKTNNNNNSNKIVTFIFRAFEHFKRKIFFTVDLCVFIVVLFPQQPVPVLLCSPYDSVNKLVFVYVRSYLYMQRISCGVELTATHFTHAEKARRPTLKLWWRPLHIQ